MSETIDAARLVQLWTTIARTLDDIVAAAEQNLPLHDRVVDEQSAEEGMAAFRIARTAADAFAGAYNRLAVNQQQQQFQNPVIPQQYVTGRTPVYAPRPEENFRQQPQYLTW